MNNSNTGVTSEDSHASMNIKVMKMERINRNILIVQATASTAANLLVILVYYSMGKTRKKFPNFLLLCTALSDLFVSGLSWFSYVVSKMRFNSMLDTLQLVHYALLDYSFSLCLGILLLSAVDRCFSVTKPFQHRKLIQLPKIKCIVIAVWIIALVPPITRLALSKFSYENIDSPTDEVFIYTYRSIIIVFILIIVIILVFTCNRVSRVIRKPLHTVIRTRVSNTSTQTTAQQRNARVIKIFICMIAAFAATFLPITIGMFLFYAGMFNDLPEDDLLVLILVGDTSYLLSSLINPIITLTVKRDFRKTIVSMFKLRRVMIHQSASKTFVTSVL